MAWGLVASAAITVGGSLLGADSAGDAADAQAAAAANTAASNERIAREARDNANARLQPYVDQGNRARAYADALLYRTPETYGGSTSAGQSPSTIDWRSYFNDPANSDLVAYYNSGGTSWLPTGGLSPEQFLQQWYAQASDPLAGGRRPAPQTYAQTGSANNGATTVTYGDAMAALEGGPLYQWNEQDYAKRQNLTDQEHAAWQAMQEAQNDKAVTSLKGFGGATGRTGAMRRGVADVGNTYALAATDRQYQNRKSDYDTYAAGRTQAYGDFTGKLKDRTDTGYSAASGQASAGQSYAGLATNANLYQGNAAQDAAARQGYIKGQLYGDIADAAGGAYAAFTKQRGAASPYSFSYSMPSSFTGYSGGTYQAGPALDTLYGSGAYKAKNYIYN